MVAGDDFVEEADAEGFGGGDDLAGKDESEGGAAADEAGEALGSAVAGDDAELDLGLAEAGGCRWRGGGCRRGRVRSRRRARSRRCRR